MTHLELNDLREVWITQQWDSTVSDNVRVTCPGLLLNNTLDGLAFKAPDPSSSFTFPAIPLGFSIFGEIFAYVMVLLLLISCTTPYHTS